MTTGKPLFVIASIRPPKRVIRTCALQCAVNGFEFIVVGDAKSPTGFSIDGCCFIALDDPAVDVFRFAVASLVGHCARKNIGYLAAISAGASLIVEADDDNEPMTSFRDMRREREAVHCLAGGAGSTSIDVSATPSAGLATYPRTPSVARRPPRPRSPSATPPGPFNGGSWTKILTSMRSAGT